MKFALEPPSMECFNSPDGRTQNAKSQTESSACSFRTFAKASQECGPDSWKRSAFCNGNKNGPPAEGEMYRGKSLRIMQVTRMARGVLMPRHMLRFQPSPV
jgi:hypothetical protein